MRGPIATVNLIDEMACAGHQRASILAQFRGLEKLRTAQILARIYEMRNDTDVFWHYSYAKFHGEEVPQ